MDLSLTDILLRLVCGGAIGFIIGLTGIGAGVLGLPALTLLMGLPSTVAVGTAGLYAFLTKSVAAWRHIRLKNVDFRCAIMFLSGALPANLVTAVLMNRYVTDPSRSADEIAKFQGGLNTVMVGMILLSATVMILSTMKKFSSSAGEPTAFRKLMASNQGLSRVVAFFGGAFVGAEVGATSIGGGTLQVVLLVVVLGLRADRTVGTSLFISMLLTLVTSSVYLLNAQIHIPTVLWMLPGSMLGAYIGSHITVKSSEKHLHLVITVLVILAAITMLVKGGH